jgi:hypothetical protein
LDSEFSDKVKSLALTAPGAHLLQFCLDVIDDTVALRKQVCTELVADPATLTELLGSRTCGLRVLLHLLAPHSQRHFAQHELDFITPPTLQHADGLSAFPSFLASLSLIFHIFSLCNTERASVVISKKDPAVRHKELLSDRILPSILAACTENDEVLSTMLRDAHQCSVVVEALREAADSDAGLAALERVAAMVAGSIQALFCTRLFNLLSIVHLILATADPESENVTHLLTHPVAHRCLRRLIFIEQPEAENRRAERHKGKDQPAVCVIFPLISTSMSFIESPCVIFSRWPRLSRLPLRLALQSCCISISAVVTVSSRRHAALSSLWPLWRTARPTSSNRS